MIEVHRLHLTDVTPDPNLPWTRPTFPVFAYLIDSPEGPILVDTGVGHGNDLIDALYSPVHYDLGEVLRRHGVEIDEVGIVIVSHLHFDHCGQNKLFRHARIVVQAREVEAAREPGYTVPEWAFPPGIELEEIDGESRIADGVRAVATPGHTPGHQSVVIDTPTGSTTVIGCQASWNVAGFANGALGDEGWDQELGARSVDKLGGLEPARVLFSHDHGEWTSAL